MSNDMSNRFKPTHVIHYNGGSRAGPNQRMIPVQLVDGVCYTAAEWRYETPADWEFDGEFVTFHGERMPATLRKI